MTDTNWITDKGDEWVWSWMWNDPRDMWDEHKQALHDRDRYHREAEYWREQCINMTAEALR